MVRWILIWIILLISEVAGGVTWHPLSPLHRYSASDFHLRGDVGLFQLKSCQIDLKRQKCEGRVSTVLDITTQPRQSFPHTLLEHLHQLTPKPSPQNNIRASLLPHHVTHGFSIDSQQVVWRLNEIKDILALLGTIDTPAEAQLVLWLHGKANTTRYRKVKQGYMIQREEQRYPPCIGGIDYEERLVYQSIVSPQGRILKERLIQHTKTPIKPHKPLMRKPAIYLYPTDTTTIDVTLTLNGSLVTSIPPYHEGWHVSVESNGTINGKYDYLFYENTLNTITLPDEGWIVAGEELEAWCDHYLPLMGLNARERKDFKAYWLKALDPHTLYEIKRFSEAFLQQTMQLTVTPTPDSMVRVLLNFKAIPAPYPLTTPTLHTPQRIGFHLLEWGGRITPKGEQP